MFVWRLRENIIGIVLCCAVLCKIVVHPDVHTKMSSSYNFLCSFRFLVRDLCYAGFLCVCFGVLFSQFSSTRAWLWLTCLYPGSSYIAILPVHVRIHRQLGQPQTGTFNRSTMPIKSSGTLVGGVLLNIGQPQPKCSLNIVHIFCVDWDIKSQFVQSVVSGYTSVGR